jgi:hypothetical protein
MLYALSLFHSMRFRTSFSEIPRIDSSCRVVGKHPVLDHERLQRGFGVLREEDVMPMQKAIPSFL